MDLKRIHFSLRTSLMFAWFCVLCVFIFYHLDKVEVAHVPWKSYLESYDVGLGNATKKEPMEKLPLQRKNPIILYYNRPEWLVFPDNAACPYKCSYTDDRNRWDDSDAVLFVASDIPRVPKRKKKKGQIWIFFTLESPITYPSGFVQWKNLINWTMTYRLDSDILFFNHEIVKEENTGYDPPNKSESISWLVSHCNVPSRRDEFTKILQKYIKVDIFGKCGTMQINCNSIANNKCWREYFQKYFFYLSAENSFCRDYITEKAYNPLNNSIVPIVRGGAFYNKYFPSQSYINTANFKTVERLSDYLKYLIENEADYQRYFGWRKHYKARVYKPLHKTYCELCRRLHFKDKYRRWYQSLYDWWVTGAQCNSTIQDLQ